MSKRRKHDPNGRTIAVRNRDGTTHNYFCTYTAQEYEKRFGRKDEGWQSK